MAYKLVVKDHPEIEIIQTKQLIPASAGLTNPRFEDGQLEFDYVGGSRIFWDDQYQVRNVAHERVFLDNDGAEYLESEIELIEAPDDE